MTASYNRAAAADSGFTLIELSIVLVIIGLIIGGILVGQDLIRNAEVRATIDEIEKYKTAIQTFRLKYNALPGDFKTAESIWGSDVSCPDTPPNTDPKTVTCNGNGDEKIDVQDFSNLCERHRVWQHLSNANFIPGAFSGTTGAANCGIGSGIGTGPGKFVIGVHVPKGRLPGSFYLLLYLEPTDYPAYGYALSKHFFILNGPQTFPGVPSVLWGGPSMTPNMAYNIDQKTDDGDPANGTIMEFENVSGFASNHPPGCVITSGGGLMSYRVDTDKKICALLINAGF